MVGQAKKGHDSPVPPIQVNWVATHWTGGLLREGVRLGDRRRRKGRTNGVLMVNVWALTPATRTARATRGAENDFMAGAGRRATSVPVGSETEGTGRKVGASAGGGLYRDGFGRCLFGPRARPSRGRWRGAGPGRLRAAYWLPTG